MSLRHLAAIVRKEINHIVRDPYTLFLVLLSPAVLMFLMAYALSVDLRSVPISVLDQEMSQSSRRFISFITSGEDLELYSIAADMDEVEILLLRGTVKAVLILPPNFTKDLHRYHSGNLQIIIDGTEPASGGFAVQHIGSRAEEFAVQAILDGQKGLMGLPIPEPGIDLRIQPWFNPSLKPRNDLIPGLLSIALGLPAMLVALTISQEREHGTLEQLLATPVLRSEILFGKMLPYMIVGLINVIVIPIFSILWFRVPFNGNFIQFFLISIVFMFAILGMGIVVGVFMRTQSAALALSFLLIFFPGFFLTGIFFPIISMPEVMRLESLGMPGTHFGIITRGVFLMGSGIETLWPYVLMLFGLGSVFLMIANMFFKKQLG